MSWQIIKEITRKYADESYYFKAVFSNDCYNVIIEADWAQIMYVLNADLIVNSTKTETLFSSMVYCDDNIEKYTHQLVRIANHKPIEKIKRLQSLFQDGVLNFTLCENFNYQIQ